jgi:hypothetical protein
MKGFSEVAEDIFENVDRVAFTEARRSQCNGVDVHRKNATFSTLDLTPHTRGDKTEEVSYLGLKETAVYVAGTMAEYIYQFLHCIMVWCLFDDREIIEFRHLESIPFVVRKPEKQGNTHML